MYIKDLDQLSDNLIFKGENSRGEKCYYAYFGKVIIDVIRNATTRTLQVFHNLQRVDLTQENLGFFISLYSNANV